MEQLEKAYASLMECANPPSKCPECGQLVFSSGSSRAADRYPCMDCQGVTVQDFVLDDGQKMRGLVNRLGTPLLFGGIEEMNRLWDDERRRKAASAGCPVSAMYPQAQYPPSPEPEERFTYGPIGFFKFNEDEWKSRQVSDSVLRYIQAGIPRFKYDSETETFTQE